MFLRFLAVAALGLVLSGCVTVNNTLSPDQVAALRLQSVDVTIAPNARISWPDPGNDYMRSRGIETPEAWAAAEGQIDAHTRQVIMAKLRDSMLRELGGDLRGTRPVRIVVRVHEFEVTPGAVRLLFGGDHEIKADVDVVDARTGAPILVFPALHTFIQGGRGVLGVAFDNLLLDDPAERVIRLSAVQYRNWLLRK